MSFKSSEWKLRAQPMRYHLVRMWHEIWAARNSSKFIARFSTMEMETRRSQNEIKWQAKLPSHENKAFNAMHAFSNASNMASLFSDGPMNLDAGTHEWFIHMRFHFSWFYWSLSSHAYNHWILVIMSRRSEKCLPPAQRFCHQQSDLQCEYSKLRRQGACKSM